MKLLVSENKSMFSNILKFRLLIINLLELMQKLQLHILRVFSKDDFYVYFR